MNNNTKYVKFSNRGDVDSGKALASQPEARKEGDAKMVLDTGLPTSPHLTGAAEGPTPDAAPKVGQGPGVTEADCALCSMLSKSKSCDEWEKIVAAQRHATEQAAVAAAVAPIIEQRRELKFKVFQQQLQLTEAFDTEKQLRAELDTFRNLLMRVTGSLGLIRSGADPKAPGYAQNYEDARSVLESGQYANAQPSAVAERDEQIRRLRDALGNAVQLLDAGNHLLSSADVIVRYKNRQEEYLWENLANAANRYRRLTMRTHSHGPERIVRDAALQPQTKESAAQPEQKTP